MNNDIIWYTKHHKTLGILHNFSHSLLFVQANDAVLSEMIRPVLIFLNASLNQAVALSRVNDGIKLCFWIFIVKDQKQSMQNRIQMTDVFKIEVFFYLWICIYECDREKFHHKVVLSSFPFTFLENTKRHSLTH